MLSNNARKNSNTHIHIFLAGAAWLSGFTFLSPPQEAKSEGRASVPVVASAYTSDSALSRWWNGSGALDGWLGLSKPLKEIGLTVSGDGREITAITPWGCIAREALLTSRSS